MKDDLLDDLPTVEQLRAIKRWLWLNTLVNEIVRPLGLMIFFSGWRPSGICRRPKIRLYGGKPRIMVDVE